MKIPNRLRFFTAGVLLASLNCVWISVAAADGCFQVVEDTNHPPTCSIPAPGQYLWRQFDPYTTQSCVTSLNPFAGCAEYPVATSQKDTVLNGANCTGTVISSTNWYGTGVSTLAYAYPC